MIIIPAIDLVGGECVRLVRGDYSTASKVAADPLMTAQSFAHAGAGYIHMVDLDGAKAGKRVNDGIITRVARAVSVPVEAGGGIRCMDDVDFYIKSGVSRVILGSAVVSDRSFLTEAIKKYGDRIAVGIDAANRRVRVSGWTDDGGTDFIEFAKFCAGAGVRNIIFTDISKDGTLSGPNLSQLSELKNAVDADITASGGVSCMDDIRALAALGLYGAICGKSVYTGALNLSEAIAYTDSL